MSTQPRKRAARNTRKRPAGRGMGRFEVTGLREDRELIRMLAKRLAENGAEAPWIRDVVREALTPDPRPRGGIWRALRESPLVGADLDLRRPFVP